MVVKKSKLDKYKLKFEDSNKKFHVSESFGKKEPWIVRAWWATVYTVLNFLSDLFTAFKAIIKEIM